MQLEDKLVESQEAARDEVQHREELLEHGEETLPEPVVEAVEDAGVKLRGELLGAIRVLLDRQELSISTLRLPAREAGALEALQTAALGRGSLGQLVYATDRRDLLEQALAVLQPNLSRAGDLSAHELRAQFDDLTERVGELRHELLDLEDAQDEMLEGQHRPELAKDPTEPGDKPKPAPSDPDAPRPATTLTGPERPEPAPPPTTLTGPERPESPSPPSMLGGPELPAEARPASSLGEPGEIDEAAKAKRPWWRRPFG